MKKGKNIFWGILFILGALALIVGKMGYLEGLGFWTVLFTIGLAGLLIDGIFHRSFGTVLFSIAFLAILHDDLLGIESITPWPVLGAALLGTVGLNIIFPRNGHWKSHFKKDWHGTKEDVMKEYVDGEQVRFECSFGESVKYITSKELSFVNMESSFGSLTVYFDNAELKNGTANVYVECSFGNTVIYVPSDWRVLVNVNSSFGGVEEKGHCNPTGTTTLQIMGEVSFGALEIRYL